VKYIFIWQNFYIPPFNFYFEIKIDSHFVYNKEMLYIWLWYIFVEDLLYFNNES